MVKEVDAAVTLDFPISEAMVLDGNGNPDGRNASVVSTAAGAKVNLPIDSLYTLVRR
jgi:hypothetical protein